MGLALGGDFIASHVKAFVENFKALAIGTLLLVVLGSFVHVGLVSANITGIGNTVLTFLIPAAGMGLLLRAFDVI